jgi:hypothetical protein
MPRPKERRSGDRLDQLLGRVLIMIVFAVMVMAIQGFAELSGA